MDCPYCKQGVFIYPYAGEAYCSHCKASPFLPLLNEDQLRNALEKSKLDIERLKEDRKVDMEIANRVFDI